MDVFLKEYFPKSELPFGFMTHMANGDLQKNYGYTHWYTMFNPRQLLVHGLLLKTIDTATGFSQSSKEIALGAFQQYLQNQSVFCHYDGSRDTSTVLFANNNFYPKKTYVENCVFAELGRGNWNSSQKIALKGLEWAKDTWETVANSSLDSFDTFKPQVSEFKIMHSTPSSRIRQGFKLHCKCIKL